MSNANTTQPRLESMEAAIRILAYNTSVQIWQNSGVHGKDFKIIRSLADAPYAWTEKQGNLAVLFLKRYKTLLEKFNFDVDELIKNPRYEQPFRILSFEKSVDISYADGEEWLEMRFPYNEKLIALIRCLKKKTQELVPMLYDGEIKKWTMKYTDIVAYYVTLIAIRYDFVMLSPRIFQDYEEVSAEKKQYTPIIADTRDGVVKLLNAPDSLTEYWKQCCQSLSYLQQRDQLKYLGISSVRSNSAPATTLTEKIAYSSHTDIYVDRKIYDKKTLLQAITELNDLPAICPFSGELDVKNEITTVYDWLNEFYAAGISDNDISFGFQFNKPLSYQTQPEIEEFPTPDFVYGADTTMAQREQIFNQWKILYDLSLNNRKISSQTKIIFVRNKIPRTLLRSGIKPKIAFMLQDLPMWAMSTNTLEKLVESLPKRLYYMSQKPSDKIQSV